jgi:hypothetical protein
MNARTPLVVLRWVAVVLAVVAWLVVIPLVELVLLAGRSVRRLARGLFHRDGRSLAVAGSTSLEAGTRELEPEPSEIRQRRVGSR